MTAILLATGLALAAPTLQPAPSASRPQLVDPLRPPSLEPILEGGGAQSATTRRGVLAGLACVAAAVVPGLGHAVAGEYFPRGLAFTGAFVASLIGGVAFVVHGTQSGSFRGETVIGAVTLIAIAEIVYVWSVVDAIIRAARPGTPDLSKAVILGQN